MKLNVLRVAQGGREVYVTKLSGKNLLSENIKTDEWTRAHQEGYQREPNLPRANAFQRYLALGNVAPTAIVLSVREKVRFISTDNIYGILDIPTHSTMWLVDGQHRVAGIRQLAAKGSSFEDFEVPVTIMCPGNWTENINEAEYEELAQFLIINKTQKGVRPDLAERLLSRMAKENPKLAAELPLSISRGLDWVPSAIDIAEMLNKEDGPWKNKIRFPNEPKGRAIISQKSFTDSLKPILLGESFRGYPVEQVEAFVQRYWEAIKELCPEAFQDPQRFVLQKLTGTFVLHRLFADVARCCKDRLLTKKNLLEVLKSIPDVMTDAYWSINGTAGLAGTNQKNIGILERTIRARLESENQGREAERSFRL